MPYCFTLRHLTVVVSARLGCLGQPILNQLRHKAIAEFAVENTAWYTERQLDAGLLAKKTHSLINIFDV